MSKNLALVLVVLLVGETLTQFSRAERPPRQKAKARFRRYAEEECPCDYDGESKTINCTADGAIENTEQLTSCPVDEVVTLWISHQNITTVSKLDYKNLQELEISHNQLLSSVSADAFTALPKLTVARIAYNPLLEIPPGSLDYLIGAKTMYLMGNNRNSTAYKTTSYTFMHRLVMSPDNLFPLVVIGTRVVLNGTMNEDISGKSDSPDDRFCKALVSAIRDPSRLLSKNCSSSSACDYELTGRSRQDLVAGVCFLNYGGEAKKEEGRTQVFFPVDDYARETPEEVPCGKMRLFAETNRMEETEGSVVQAFFVHAEIDADNAVLADRRSDGGNPISGRTEELTITADTLVLKEVGEGMLGVDPFKEFPENATVDEALAGGNESNLTEFEPMELIVRRLAITGRQVILNDAIPVIMENNQTNLQILQYERVYPSEDTGYGMRLRVLGGLEVSDLFTPRDRVLGREDFLSISFPINQSDMTVLCGYKLRDSNELVYLDGMVETYAQAQTLSPSNELRRVSRNLETLRRHMPRVYLKTAEDGFVQAQAVALVEQYLAQGQLPTSNNYTLYYGARMPQNSLDETKRQLLSLVRLSEGLNDEYMRVEKASTRLKSAHTVTVQKLSFRRLNDHRQILQAKQTLKMNADMIQNTAQLIFNQTAEFAKYMADNINELRKQIAKSAMENFDVQSKAALQQRQLAIKQIGESQQRLQEKQGEVQEKQKEFKDNNNDIKQLRLDCQENEDKMEQEMKDWKDKKEAEATEKMAWAIFGIFLAVAASIVVTVATGGAGAAAAAASGAATINAIDKIRVVIRIAKKILEFVKEMIRIQMLTRKRSIQPAFPDVFEEAKEVLNEFDFGDYSVNADLGEGESDYGIKLFKVIKAMNQVEAQVTSFDKAEEILGENYRKVSVKTDKEVESAVHLMEDYQNIADKGRDLIAQAQDLKDLVEEAYNLQCEKKEAELMKEGYFRVWYEIECAKVRLKELTEKADAEFANATAQFEAEYARIRKEFNKSLDDLKQNAKLQIDKTYEGFELMLTKQNDEEEETYNRMRRSHNHVRLKNRAGIHENLLRTVQFLDRVCDASLYYLITPCKDLVDIPETVDAVTGGEGGQELFPILHGLHTLLVQRRPTVELSGFRDVLLTPSQHSGLFESLRGDKRSFTTSLAKLGVKNTAPYSYTRVSTLRISLLSDRSFAYSLNRSGLVRSAVSFDPNSLVADKSNRVHLVHRAQSHICDNSYLKPSYTQGNQQHFPLQIWDCLKTFEDGENSWNRYSPTLDTRFTFRLESPIEEFDMSVVDGILVQYRAIMFVQKKKSARAD